MEGFKIERLVIVKGKMSYMTADQILYKKSNGKKYTFPGINANGWIVNLILAYMFYHFEPIDENKPNVSFITTFDYIGDNISGFTISNKNIGIFTYKCSDYGFDYFDDDIIYEEQIDKMINDIQKDFHIKSICPCKWYEQKIEIGDNGNITIKANADYVNSNKLNVPNDIMII